MKIILRGGTRIVVLLGNKAYKIARFRPIRLLCRMLLFPFQTKRKQTKFYQRYGELPTSLWNYIVVGFTINRTEFEYWNRTHDSRVMPVVDRFVGYFIIVQMRGKEVLADEFRMNDLFGSLPLAAYHELQCDKLHQFVKLDGKILLIDYGDKYTVKALMGSAG